MHVRQLPLAFRHGFALELDALSVVREPTANDVCQSTVVDGGVPLVSGQLPDDECGGLVVSVIHDFHGIVAMSGLECLATLVIDHEYPVFKELGEQLEVAASGLGLRQAEQQALLSEIASAVAL